MSSVIRENGRQSLIHVLPPPPSTVSGRFSAPDLTALPGSHSWWYVVPAKRRTGGLWNRSGGQVDKVLPWCPEVLARIVALDADGVCCQQYYTVRVGQQLGLLCDSDLFEGKGWEQFAGVDLWQALELKDVLAEVVQAQARQLPRIVFRQEEL